MARSERNQANQSFAQAMQVVDKLTSLNQKFPASPESDRIREQTYREVKDFYEGFAKLRSGDPVVSSQMAQAHFRLSDLSMLLGHREDARSSAKIAVQRYRELVTEDSDSTLYDQYGKALWQLATTQRGFNADGAVSNFNLAVEVYETLVARHPNNIDYKIALGNALSNRGSLFHNIRQPGMALDSIGQAVTLLESPSSQDRRAAFELSLALEVLGGIRMARGEHERAYDVAVRSLNLRKSFVDMDRVSDGHKYVARSLVELGKLSDRLGRTEVARQHYSEAINVQKRLVDQYPMRPRYAQLLNYFLYVSSHLESRQGDIVTATAQYENLLAVAYRSLGQSEMSIEDQLSFATQMLDTIDRLLALSKIPSATNGLEQLFENLPQHADGPTYPQLLGRFMQTAAKAIRADLDYAEKDLRLSAILKDAQRESRAVQDPHPVLANALNATAAALRHLEATAIRRPATVRPQSD